MSHVLNYGGQYFRVDVTEVANPDNPGKAMYVSWCSDAFKELKDAPSQAFSQFIVGPPLPEYSEALRYAYDWVKSNWDAQQAKREYKAGKQVGDLVSVLYTVWLFKGESSFAFIFEEFSAAKSFARAAEKSVDITKVGITNNESPQYLTIWEKGEQG